jgi:hypothetical protein
LGDAELDLGGHAKVLLGLKEGDQLAVAEWCYDGARAFVPPSGWSRSTSAAEDRRGESDPAIFTSARPVWKSCRIDYRSISERGLSFTTGRKGVASKLSITAAMICSALLRRLD